MSEPFDIFKEISSYDRAKTAGVLVLIYMSLREKTSIAYQHKELGFTDIPDEIVAYCDEQEEDMLLWRAAQIAEDMFDDLFLDTDLTTPAALATENAETLACKESGVLPNDD